MFSNRLVPDDANPVSQTIAPTPLSSKNLSSKNLSSKNLSSQPTSPHSDQNSSVRQTIREQMTREERLYVLLRWHEQLQNDEIAIVLEKTDIQVEILAKTVKEKLKAAMA